MLVWAESANLILIQHPIIGLVEGHDAYWL
jgi:hypothetical protein